MELRSPKLTLMSSRSTIWGVVDRTEIKIHYWKTHFKEQRFYSLSGFAHLQNAQSSSCSRKRYFCISHPNTSSLAICPNFWLWCYRCRSIWSILVVDNDDDVCTTRCRSMWWTSTWARSPTGSWPTLGAPFLFLGVAVTNISSCSYIHWSLC